MRFRNDSVEVVRDPSHKNYDSYENYPHSHYYPYCTGSGYLLRVNLLPCLLKVLGKYAWSNNEDVNTGLWVILCNQKASSDVGYQRTALYFDENPNYVFSIYPKNQINFMIHGIYYENHSLLQKYYST